MQITTLEPGNARQHQELAEKAAEVLRGGGLVVFPTETVYGVAASALSDKGVEKLRRLKQSDAGRAFTVHIPDPEDIQRFAELSVGGARRLAKKAMPGPITLLVEVAADVRAKSLKGLGLTDEHTDRLYHDGVVGLRCPDHDLGRMVLFAGGPAVIATSANLPGERPPVEAQEAADAIADWVDLVVDGGRCQHAKPSTIVKISGSGARQELTVQREGVYDERYVRKLMRYTMMMVCTGNTCRSPMAEGIARQMVATHLDILPKDLESAGIEIVSAGAFASSGAPATPEAARAVANEGIDISKHRSTPLTRELVDSADVIYCMTDSHRDAVLSLVPSARGKTHRLDPGADIPDPIGADDVVYRATAEAIRRGLTGRLKELPL